MEEQALDHPEVSRPALWFGLLGGGMAWLAHLLLAYLLAEFGCLTGLREATFLGVTAVAWLILVVSAATLAAAIASAVAARGVGRQLGEPQEEPYDARAAERYMARTGLLLGVLFAFVIVVQTVPVFYFLKDC